VPTLKDIVENIDAYDGTVCLGSKGLPDERTDVVITHFVDAENPLPPGLYYYLETFVIQEVLEDLAHLASERGASLTLRQKINALNQYAENDALDIHKVFATK
jgi:hypothetical protein